MTKKRKRLEDELKKLIAKKAEVEARITETQDQIQEETNIEIHEMVHAAHLTPEQLADVLAAFRKGSIPVNAMDMLTGPRERNTPNVIRSAMRSGLSWMI